MAREKKKLSEVLVVVAILAIAGVCWAVVSHYRKADSGVELNYQGF